MNQRKWAGAEDPSSGSGQGSGLDHHRNKGPDRAGAPRGGSLKSKGGVGMLMRHAEEFGLSEDQMDQLESMYVENELEKVDKRAELRKAKIRLRAAIMADACEKDVMALIDETCRCEGEIRRMRYSHLTRARKVLNDGQRHKVNQYRRKQQAKRVEEHREALKLA